MEIDNVWYYVGGGVLAFGAGIGVGAAIGYRSGAKHAMEQCEQKAKDITSKLIGNMKEIIPSQTQKQTQTKEDTPAVAV